MGHMFLLICVSHIMSLYARHHVWPETHEMLGTLLCLLSSCHWCMCTTGRTSGICRSFLFVLWPCHSQTALIHFWPVCLSTASSTYGYNFRRAVMPFFLLHLLLFPTIARDIHYFCATLQLISPLWQQQSFWFSHLILPWQNYYANGASWGDGVGWEHPRLKCHKPRFFLSKFTYLSLINACQIVICP